MTARASTVHAVIPFYSDVQQIRAIIDQGAYGASPEDREDLYEACRSWVHYAAMGDERATESIARDIQTLVTVVVFDGAKRGYDH